MQFRGRRLSAKLPEASNELLLSFNVDVLSSEEDDSTLRDEGSEVAEKIVGVGGSEKIGDLNRPAGEIGTDGDGGIEVLELEESTVGGDLQRGCESVFGTCRLDGDNWRGGRGLLGDLEEGLPNDGGLNGDFDDGRCH